MSDPTIARAKLVLVNELGNCITLVVTSDHREVIVVAEGPTSSVEHTWTRLEAIELHRLLGSVLYPADLL